MAGTDFSHLTNDELIKGIKALDLPDYIRSKAYGIDVRETLAQMTEMTIQLGVNMGLSPDEALKWARKLQETVSQSEFDSWVATLLDGGPSIFMNTLSELQTTYPNGAPGVALVRETDPAKIYVWNGTAWEDFGDYQGIEVKDGTITTSKLSDDAVSLRNVRGIAGDLNLASDGEISKGYYNISLGKIVDAEDTSHIKIKVMGGEKISIWVRNKTKLDQHGFVFTDDGNNTMDYNVIDALKYFYKDGNRVVYSVVTVPDNASYLIINTKYIGGNWESLNDIEVVLGDKMYDSTISKLDSHNIHDNRFGKIIYNTDLTENGVLNADKYFNLLQEKIVSSVGSEYIEIPVFEVGTHSIYVRSKTGPNGMYNLGCALLSENGTLTKLNADDFIKSESKDGVVYFHVETQPDTIAFIINTKIVGQSYSKSDIKFVYGTDIDENAISSIGGAYFVDKKARRLIDDVSKPFSGKEVTFLGDSLTEINDKSTKFYHQYVAEDLGITAINMGRSGTGYKQRDTDGLAFYQRVSSVPTSTDAVVIFGSFNDLSTGIPLGTKSDTTTTTIGGAINTTIDNLFNVDATVPLGIVSPTPWKASVLSDPENNYTKYAKLLKDICSDRGIPFLDLYHSSGLRPWDENYRPLMYSRDNGYGTHPDENGHKLIYPKFREFIKTLI